MNKARAQLASGKKSSVFSKIKSFIFSSHGFPFILLLTLVCILFVLFRMKGIEQDYKQNALQEDIEAAQIDNKELKAQRAKIMSAQHLRRLAEEYDMKEPSKKQIIVVP